MPVSRIKVKNRHLKKKAKKPLAFYKPATKFAGAVLIAGTLTTTHELLLQQTSPMVQAATNSTEAFIESIAASAKPVADSNGLYPSVMIAQAILESNWGSSQLSRAPYYSVFRELIKEKALFLKLKNISMVNGSQKICHLGFILPLTKVSKTMLMF